MNLLRHTEEQNDRATREMHKWKTTENVKRTVIVKSAFWSVLNSDCFFKLMCTYLLFFYMSCISGLTVPHILTGKPNGFGNQSFQWTIFERGIKWLKGVRTWSMSVHSHGTERLCLLLFFELLFCWRLDTKSASTVLYLLLETPWQPLTSAGSYVTLRWHQWTHYTPWCWTTRRMSFWEM